MRRLIAFFLVACIPNFAAAGSEAAFLLTGVEKYDLPPVKSPDGQLSALLSIKTKYKLPIVMEPKKEGCSSRLTVFKGNKTIYNSGDEKLNTGAGMGFALDLAWSPDSKHLAFRHISSLRIIGLDGKSGMFNISPENYVITSFRWIDNSNLLVVSKVGKMPLDTFGRPYLYAGYIDEAKTIRISRFNLTSGFTTVYEQTVAEPTFIFHAATFYLDEISPNSDRVAFSDGQNLCICDSNLKKIVAKIKIPQKQPPHRPMPTPTDNEDFDSFFKSVEREMASRPAHLEGIWWPDNNTLLVGVGLLGGPTKSFYIYDIGKNSLSDKTSVLLPVWNGNQKAINYQDPDWYRSALKL